MKYRISVTESAKRDIAYFNVHEQRIIIAGIISHLQINAEVATRNRKPLRPNFLAPWELRVEQYRVFYSIEEGAAVKIVAVGHKEHNQLLIRGERVEL